MGFNNIYKRKAKQMSSSTGKCCKKETDWNSSKNNSSWKFIQTPQNTQLQCEMHLDGLCQRSAIQTKMWWSGRENRDCDSALVIFGSVLTLLSSGWRIFPQDAQPSDGAQRLGERARECEGVREEVTQHSSPNESARFLRQLKQDDPPPPHLQNVPPSVMSAQLLMASLHSLTHTDAPQCVTVWNFWV